MKKLIALFSTLSSYLYLAATSNAQTTVKTCPEGGFEALCNLTFDGGLIGKVITLVFIVAILIALFYLIYGGIRWILSEGDKQKVADARHHIIAAIIGLVIVFLSYFILNLLLSFFLDMSLQDLVLPKI